MYGHDPNDGVGGDGAFFLLLDEPEVYGLPPDPVVPTRDAGAMWKYAGMAASAMVGIAVSAFLGAAMTRGTAGGAAGRVPLVLRPADPQDAGVELDDRGLPVLRRAVGRVGDAGRRGRPDRPAGAAAGVAGLAVGEHSGELVLLGSRLGRPERFLHMLRVAKPTSPMSMGTWILSAYGPGAGSGWGCGVDAVSVAADMAGPADGMVGETGRTMGGWDGTGGRIVYRSSVVADRGSGVA